MFVLLPSIRAPRGEQPPWRKAACGPDTQHPPWDPRTGLPTGQGGVGVGASPASWGGGIWGLHCSGARPCLHLVSGSELEIQVLLPGNATFRQGHSLVPRGLPHGFPRTGPGWPGAGPRAGGAGHPSRPPFPQASCRDSDGGPVPSPPLPRTGPLLLQGHVTAESRLTAVRCYCLPVWRSGV